MPMVFPGMDPYIENQAWEDFHTRMIVTLSDQIVPTVQPKYFVRAEQRVYVERGGSRAPQIMRADIGVATAQSTRPHRDRAATVGTIEPIDVLLGLPEEVVEPFLTIRDRSSLEVVTVIELLSPSNKRPGSVGRAEYIAKRDAILNTRANLVEIDLVRGGTPIPTDSPLPDTEYRVLVSRARRRPIAEAYCWGLRDLTARVPIPLSGDDTDASIDLQSAIELVYERAGYRHSIDYDVSPDPQLRDEDRMWAQSLLSNRTP